MRLPTYNCAMAWPSFNLEHVLVLQKAIRCTCGANEALASLKVHSLTQRKDEAPKLQS